MIIQFNITDLRFSDKLVCIRLGQKAYLDTIEKWEPLIGLVPTFRWLVMHCLFSRCVSQGKILLIENLDEEIEPVLDPLLGRLLIKKGEQILWRNHWHSSRAMNLFQARPSAWETKRLSSTQASNSTSTRNWQIRTISQVSIFLDVALYQNRVIHGFFRACVYVFLTSVLHSTDISKPNVEIKEIVKETNALICL